MKTEQVNNKLEEINKKGYAIAKKHLILLLEKVFKKNKKEVDCILCSMGTIAFYKDKDVVNREDIKGYENLMNFVRKWDEIYCLTGAGIKIDKDGTKDY